MYSLRIVYRATSHYIVMDRHEFIWKTKELYMFVNPIAYLEIMFVMLGAVFHQLIAYEIFIIRLRL